MLSPVTERNVTNDPRHVEAFLPSPEEHYHTANADSGLETPPPGQQQSHQRSEQYKLQSITPVQLNFDDYIRHDGAKTNEEHVTKSLKRLTSMWKIFQIQRQVSRTMMETQIFNTRNRTAHRLVAPLPNSLLKLSKMDKTFLKKRFLL